MSDMLERLKAVTEYARANRMTEVTIDGITVKLDRSAFTEEKKEAAEQVADPYAGLCPCLHEKSHHNPETGCGEGCPEWRCAGAKEAPAQSVFASEYQQ